MIEYNVKVLDNGDREWRHNGNLHREDGPAVEFANGYKSWYLNDKLHREDGPALEYTNGYKSWYLNGKHYSEADWKIEVAKLHKPIDLCDGKEVIFDGKKYKLTLV